MQNNSMSFFALIALATLLATGGCGGGSTSSNQLTVLITPSGSQTIDQGQSLSFSAAFQNGTSNQSISWAVSCPAAPCGTLSSQTAPTITYTAPSSVSANLAVRLTARPDAAPGNLTFTMINVTPPPAITTKSLADATGGVGYQGAIQSTGGAGALSWSVSQGTMPPGISLNGDGTLSGTPTQGGSFSFTAQVTDSGNPPLSASAAFNINIIVQPLTVVTQSLAAGAVDIPYKQVLQAQGGIPPYTWSVSSGTLPTWASLNGSAGILSGIPSAQGASNFTLQVADSQPTSPFSAVQTLSLSIGTASSANNSELNGHYAFLVAGFDDASGSPIAVAGSFVADGKGNISGGIEDQFGPAASNLGVLCTGTYNVGTDNRGAFTLQVGSTMQTFALTTSSISSGVAQSARLVQFDDASGTSGQRSSGVLRLQDPTAFAASKFTGTYVIGLSGADTAGNREAVVSAFSADGSSKIQNGTADRNVAGTATTPSLLGTYSAPSAPNGRFSVTLQLSDATTLTLAAFLVSPSEILFAGTDSVSSFAVVSGTARLRTGSSFDQTSLNAPSVFYSAGQNSPSTLYTTAEMGLLSPDGVGTIAVVDDRKTGINSTLNQSFNAAYSVLPQGRVTISNWYNDSTTPPRVVYLLDKNRGFFLDTSAVVGLGFVEAQSGVPSGGFTLASLSGSLSAGTLPSAGAAGPNAVGVATLDGNGNFTEITNLSSNTGLLVDQTTTGTYALAANGRGTVTGLSITNAGIGSGIISGIILVLSFVELIRARRTRRRKGLAFFGLAIALAVTPNSCGPKFINEFVFYVTSPNTVVMFRASTSDPTPSISVLAP